MLYLRCDHALWTLGTGNVCKKKSEKTQETSDFIFFLMNLANLSLPERPKTKVEF